MHECPECWSICYCDLDDSNDCRDDGECFHECEPEEDFDDGWAEATCPGCGEPVNVTGDVCGSAECGGKRIPSASAGEDPGNTGNATKGGK